MENELFLDRDEVPIEGTTVNDDGSVTLILETEVQGLTEKVDRLVFRKPAPGALLRLDAIKSEAKRGFAMIGISANIPAPAVEKLDFADMTAASRIVGGFTRKSRKPAP